MKERSSKNGIPVYPRREQFMHNTVGSTIPLSPRSAAFINTMHRQYYDYELYIYRDY